MQGPRYGLISKNELPCVRRAAHCTRTAVFQRCRQSCRAVMKTKHIHVNHSGEDAAVQAGVIFLLCTRHATSFFAASPWKRTWVFVSRVIIPAQTSHAHSTAQHHAP